MANSRAKDPTEAALSAIQEALNLGDDQIHVSDRSDSLADPLGGETDTGRPSAAHDEGVAGPFESRGDLPGPRVANDDQQSIGHILQALQRRPARTSYFVASIFSAAWLVGCLALSWAYLSELNAALGPNHSPAAIMIGLGAAALLPIIFFFGVAQMAWRAQELRLIEIGRASCRERVCLYV